MHNTPVREFHEAFGAPVEWQATIPSEEQIKLRIGLIAEELKEFAEACGYEMFIDFTKNINNSEVDLVAAADALGDLRYVIDGGNLVFGFDGEAVLDEIHRSNMSKLGDDGKPVYRDDGKVLKGPDYFPPNLSPILGLDAIDDGF